MPISLGIRAKIFALTLPAMLTPPLWVGCQASQRELTRSTQQGRTEAYAFLERAGTELKELIQQAGKDLDTISNLPSVTDFYAYREIELKEEAEQHRKRIIDASLSLARSRPHYRVILLLDQDKNIIASNRSVEKCQRLKKDLEELSQKSQKTASLLPASHNATEWFQRQGQDGRWSVIARKALRDRWGELRGHIAIKLNLEKLSKAIRGSAPEAFQLLLLFRGHQVLPLDLALSSALKDNPQIGWLASETQSNPKNIGTQFEFFGGPKIDSKLQLGVLISKSYLYANVNQIYRNTLFQICFALLSSILLTAWLAATFSKRIRTLSKAAKNIGEGNYDHKILIEGTDELSQLGDTFNRMGSQVQQSEQALRNRIEEIQNARDQLIQAEKLSAIGTMASGVAHEIRSPLQTIAIKASTLKLHAKRQQMDRSKLSKLAEAVTQEIERANEIIQALQDYSRSSSHHREFASVSLEEVLQKTITLAQVRYPDRHVIFKNEWAGTIQGDFNQLVQVFLNLVNNAFAASDPRDAIAVQLEAATFTEEDATQAIPLERGNPFLSKQSIQQPILGATGVQISVCDRGKGISKEQLDRIFDPFFTTKRTGEGTGLGLSIALGIVSLHNGTLTVVSEEKVGSEFIVKFPTTPQGE